MRHDVATNGFLGVSHGHSVHLRHHLIGYEHSHIELIGYRWGGDTSSAIRCMLRRNLPRWFYRMESSPLPIKSVL
jgi:hypothetical protein